MPDHVPSDEELASQEANRKAAAKAKADAKTEKDKAK